MLSVGSYTPLAIPQCATWNPTGITVAGHQNAASGSDLASLNYPIDIFIDCYDTLYVADGNNNRIVKYYANATSSILVAGVSDVGSGASPLGLTRDLHIDQNGDVYVSDSDNNRVVKYNPNNGTRTIIAGNNGGGSAANQFSSSYGSFVDENQTVYVADYGNQRVQKWFAGATSGVTVAGVTATAGSSSTHLSGPLAVAVDTNGYGMISSI